MFHFIEPQEHHLYQSSIDPFLKELQDSKILQRNQNLKQATFILAEEKVKGIHGGILLLKQSITTLSSEVGEYLHTFFPQTKEIWTGMVALMISEDITGRDFEKICKTLYPALYEDLIFFGIKESSPFLCLTMPTIEHLTIDMLGFWPYVLEVRPSASSDGLFHGILSLADTRQELIHFWKNDNNLQVQNLLGSLSAFQSLSAQNCNKIATLNKKMKPFFSL